MPTVEVGGREVGVQTIREHGETRILVTVDGRKVVRFVPRVALNVKDAIKSMAEGVATEYSRQCGTFAGSPDRIIDVQHFKDTGSGQKIGIFTNDLKGTRSRKCLVLDVPNALRLAASLTGASIPAAVLVAERVGETVPAPYEPSPIRTLLAQVRFEPTPVKDLLTMVDPEALVADWHETGYVEFDSVDDYALRIATIEAQRKALATIEGELLAGIDGFVDKLAGVTKTPIIIDEELSRDPEPDLYAQVVSTLKLTPELEARVNPPDRHQHRSVSQITSYAECGYRYKLERVVKVPQTPAWWFVGGSAFHTFVEFYEREALRGAWLNEEDAAVAFSNALVQAIIDELAVSEVDSSSWRAAAKGTEGEEWWFTNGAKMARLYARNNPPDRPFKTLILPDGEPAIEMPFKIAAGNVWVEGFIDHLTIDNNGYVDVVDFKSGSRRPVGKFQLELYAAAVEKFLGVRVARVSYYMTRPRSDGQHLSSYSWTPDRLPFIEHQVMEMDRAERAGIYLPVVTSFCGGCGVREYCPFGGTGDEVL